jgi:hypothetical protein
MRRMQLPSKFWADLGTRHFAQLAASDNIDQAVAVLPVAAIEQHGPHLPVCVDATLVDSVINAALPHLPAALPVLFLPTQQVGLSIEHIRFPGTLTLPSALQLGMSFDAVAQADRGIGRDRRHRGVPVVPGLAQRGQPLGLAPAWLARSRSSAGMLNR